jgi:GWxTD domain-containing protein
VRDEAGAPVRRFGWRQEIPGGVLTVPGASTVEHFTFAAPAGRYAVEVAVTDSASGRVARAASHVAAYDTRPPASDLLVSSAVRRGAEGDTAAAPGEIRKGTIFLAAATRPVLMPSQPRLFYYLELYPPPLDVALAAGGGVGASGLDLTGLPPGDYRLEVSAAFPETTVARTAEFTMAGFETEAAVARVSGGGAAGAFGNLAEASLDSLYQPLIYLLESDERGVYHRLSLEGKRNFLSRFWARRDPSPGEAANEAQAAFYRRIADANQRFREGGAGDVPGWRTDRGRILITYGEPDDVLRRPQSGPTNPYEVWKYTRGRPRKFVFLDETRLGNYVLIFTDERREPSRVDWERKLGPEAVQDILRF